MANTFTQIYIQLVFAVSGRQSLIRNEFKDELYKYMTGIVQQRHHKLITINGMPDHVHLLVGLYPQDALSDLVRDIKAFSSKHVNDNRWVHGKFAWQQGFGGFSYSRSQLQKVIDYISNQEKHHRQRTFREEYLGLLQKFAVEYDERYLFKWVEDDGEEPIDAR
jgi:REP element-mobilizing transposase RayT